MSTTASASRASASAASMPDPSSPLTLTPSASVVAPPAFARAIAACGVGTQSKLPYASAQSWPR